MTSTAESSNRTPTPGKARWLKQALRTWQARVGVAILIAFLVLAIWGALWPPDDSTSADLYAPISGTHLLGTDSLGRDVLARLVGGGSKIILVSFLAATTCVTVSAFIAAVIVSRGGWVDQASMRSVDVLISFPTIVSALLAAALLPPGYMTLFLITAVLQMPPVIRVSRAIFADVFSRDYMSVAALRGDRVSTIIWREAVPNTTGPLSVELAIRWSSSLLFIAGLNFLGVGVQPPNSDWGLMLQENRQSLIVAPWASLAPAIALALLAIGINFTADGISGAIGRGGDVVDMAR